MSPVSSPENEVIFRIELPLEEDLVAELERFIYLGRLSIVEEALQILDEILWPHLRHFPVVAESAAFLIEHNMWSKLQTLLDDLHRRDIIFSIPDEMEFVMTLRIFLEHKVYEPAKKLIERDLALTEFDAEDFEDAYISPAKASSRSCLTRTVLTDWCRCKHSN